MKTKLLTNYMKNKYNRTFTNMLFHSSELMYDLCGTISGEREEKSLRWFFFVFGLAHLLPSLTRIHCPNLWMLLNLSTVIVCVQFYGFQFLLLARKFDKPNDMKSSVCIRY